MLFCYDGHFYCTSCVENGLVDIGNIDPTSSHLDVGKLKECEGCKNKHVLVCPRKVRALADRKVTLSLSVPLSLKNRIDEKCKSLGVKVGDIVNPLIIPVLQHEFPETTTGDNGDSNSSSNLDS